MTDNRYKWTVAVAAITITVIAAMIIFVPGKHSYENHSKQSALSEYVYVDRYGIVHADRKCSRLNYKGNKSKRVHTHDFKADENTSFCPKCVSDSEYEDLIY